ncbi:DNA primase [Bacillus solimangrovi]|uniref:DNA primase n=1 Tax=Bacillus solimangrovi TaxID=1305675 RepID=A0A1E5LI05_9BACI|nr:DNA primase [Bacillus solimangrovi]OEH93713.1 DNA primase [Bacillus solimangrovi]
MANRIPEELIEKIRLDNDIVDVVSEYVQLKKQGRNYFGLCPFHGENTPSFSVAPEKQIYHCFGCGSGGNVLTFIMNIEGLDFIEAAQHLAKRSNTELPLMERSEESTPSEGANHEIRKAFDLLKKYYHHLLVNTKDGREGLEYLDDRGFTRDVIETFGLGYAQDSWESTTIFLKKRGYSLNKMTEAGILATRQDGEAVDRFRHRIMFPIWNYRGETIAFGGRVIGDDSPKYLNSPESPIFRKSQTLYGFHLARKAMRRESVAILFEGYVDVIAAWSAGVHNGVATLGTALTEEQAGILRRTVDTVIICYDGDDAGITASDRAAKLLQQVGCQVKVALLPESMDPDDYIRAYGAESFQTGVIGASVTYMSYKMRMLRRGKNLQEAGDRIQYIEEVLTEVANLSKAVEREHYLNQLADEFSMSLDTLKDEQRRIYYQLRKSKDNQSFQRDNKQQKPLLIQKKLLPAFHNAERYLLAHMFQDYLISEKVQERVGCSFNIDVHNAIAVMLYGYYEESDRLDIGDFMQRIEDEQIRNLVSDIAMLDVSEEVSDEALEDYIRLILNHPKWQEIQHIERELREAERLQDFEMAAQIAMKMHELKKQLKRSSL